MHMPIRIALVACVRKKATHPRLPGICTLPTSFADIGITPKHVPTFGIFFPRNTAFFSPTKLLSATNKH
jgi:hypothetical protein